MDPEPEIVPPEAFNNRWAEALSIGTFKLVRHAANDSLATGQVTADRKLNIRAEQESVLTLIESQL